MISDSPEITTFVCYSYEKTLFQHSGWNPVTMSSLCCGSNVGNASCMSAPCIYLLYEFLSTLILLSCLQWKHGGVMMVISIVFCFRVELINNIML